MLYPVENEIRQVKSLDGIWKFKKEESLEEGFHEKWYEKPLADTIEMPVPASYNDITTDIKLRDHVGWVWYEREFFLPHAWTGQRIVLRFGSVTQHAVVYLNGAEITRHKGGFLPFEVEVTDILSPGENRLTVAVSNLLDLTCLPVGEHRWRQDDIYPEGILEQDYHFDFFNYSGIHRPVKLYTTPENYIEDITVSTDLDGRDGIVDYRIVRSREEETVKILLKDAEGKTVAQAEGAHGKIVISDVHPWEVGAAYLYRMDIYLGEDHYTLPIGVRTVSVSGNKFLVNGKPFYFKGFGKHEDTIIRGKGLDEALNVRDYELMKWLGANSFRTSHYPYSEEMLQMADRQGFAVILEVPAVGMNLFDDKPLFTEERIGHETLEYHKSVLTETYQRDKNHPSVVMWNVANEAHTADENAEPYFAEVFAHIRQLDSTRPVSIVLDADVRKDKVGQLADVIGINRYFSWYVETGHLEAIYPMMKKDLKDWWEKYQKPIFVSEFGADTIPGLHKLPMSIFSEEYQVEFTKENLRAMDEYDFVIGEHIWNFADFMTSCRLNRVDGNKKGIFTRDRQPKMLAYELKKRWNMN